jgi:single-stranded-DNA-specific exonuclease
MIHNIISSINNSVADNYRQKNKLLVDLELNLDDIDLRFIESLQALEPFGKGNAEPLFCTCNVKINEFRKMGRERSHGRYTFTANSSLTAIGWNLSREMEELYNFGRNIDMVYRLEINDYNGRSYPQLILEDIDLTEGRTTTN